MDLAKRVRILNKKDFGLLTIKRSAALFREPSAENGLDPTSVCYMQYSIIDPCLNNFDIDYLKCKRNKRLTISSFL